MDVDTAGEDSVAMGGAAGGRLVGWVGGDGHGVNKVLGEGQGGPDDETIALT